MESNFGLADCQGVILGDIGGTNIRFCLLYKDSKIYEQSYLTNYKATFKG